MLDNTINGLSRDFRLLRVETLVRLRWLAVFGQTMTVLVVHFWFGYPFPFMQCFAVIALSAAVNLMLRLKYPAGHRLDERAATLLLSFDVAQLCALLFFTGGLENPFVMMILAPAMIAATVLPPLRAGILGLQVVAFATILVWQHYPMPWGSGVSLELPFLYVVAVWFSVVIATAFIGVYAWRVAEEGRQLARALTATELILIREQHLSQLDGLAAAAAHELGTPLATIALVAKELSRSVPADAAATEDFKLLREQVERCRGILARLTSFKNEQRDFFEKVSIRQLLVEVAESLGSLDIKIETNMKGEGPEPMMLRNPGVTYGITNILDNAVDFAEDKVTITLHWNATDLRVEIHDDGPGYSPEVLLRLGEPYVTSRARNQYSDNGGSGGMGLGLFIAKTLIERSGAKLLFANAAPPATGAVVRIIWPRAAFERGADQEPVAGIFSESESLPGK